MGSSREIRGAFVGIIKHRQTDEYYQGAGGWTAERDKAMEFESLGAVVNEARMYNINDCCEFILRFADRSDFRVAIPL